MKSLWSDSEAMAFENDPLELRAYTSRLLGQNADLVLHGGGNTSVKVTAKNLFGDDEEILYVKGSGWDLGAIEAAGFAPVRLDVLRFMAGLDQLSDGEMVRMQRAAMTDPYAPNPSVEAVLHAIIPYKFVDHTHADAVVTISNTPDGEATIRKIYGDRLLLIPYVMPGFILAKTVYDMTRGIDWARYDGMVLMNHGVFSFDDDAKRSYQKMIDIVTMAERYIASETSLESNAVARTEADLLVLAKVRRQVAEQRGKAVYALLDDAEPAHGFACLPDLDSIACRGPLTPDHIIRTKQMPLIFDDHAVTDGNPVDSFAAAYQDYFDRNSGGEQQCLDKAPRWAVWKQRGLISFGTSLPEAGIIADISHHTIKAIQLAEQLGGWRALPEKDLFEVEYWELEQAKLKTRKTSPELQGRIALVTGAASGIGKACVEELLVSGAAVAALDVNPSVNDMYRGQRVLGIVCDVTDDAVLQRSVEQAVRHFGGLDIVVGNAGVFSASQNIEQLQDDAWDEALAVNVTSHQRLMKYSIPFLRHGIDPAIIIVGSKNVPAPGPGAAAYSASKAALTQLARIAALELGRDGIRVNCIHPNAVFDTGVWTQDVLESRAKSYGLSVDEYKTRNILRSSVSSQDVAAMVCAMAGKTFAKTTGAQVPVDGGNERVI